MKQDPIPDTNENKYAIREQATKKEIDFELPKSTRANAAQPSKMTAIIDRRHDGKWFFTFKGMPIPEALSGAYTSRNYAAEAFIEWKNLNGGSILEVRGYYEHWTRSYND